MYRVGVYKPTQDVQVLAMDHIYTLRYDRAVINQFGSGRFPRQRGTLETRPPLASRLVKTTAKLLALLLLVILKG